MDSEKKEYRMEDFEKASHELVSMFFEICETHIRDDNDEYIKALTSAAMTAREAIHTFLALLKRC